MTSESGHDLEPDGPTHPGDHGHRPVTIIVLAKLPVAGRVKTRLCPPCTPDQAAAVAEASLRDTIETATSAVSDFSDLFTGVTVCIERWGRPLPGWITSAGRSLDQSGGGLADRLADAFRMVGGPALLIGMDTPQVSVGALVAAAEGLGSHECVFGPAADGGFWLIGFRHAPPTVFQDVPMSDPETGRHQLRSIRGLGLDPLILDTLTDFDEFSQAVDIAASIPESRLHRAVSQVLALDTGRVRSTANDIRPVATP